MILNDFIVLTPAGLYCGVGGFYIDPQVAVKEAIISHAHGDHAIGGNGNVYCTYATSLFMIHRYKKQAAQDFFVKEYHSTFSIGGVEISFIPAGHIAGSAQILFKYQGIRYLYTGDYRIIPDKSCEPFEMVEADVLITETTFANPEVLHPAAASEIGKLNDTKSNIMLGAYALGKSQRIIQLLNAHCPQKNIMLHFSILPFCKIYEDLGFELGNYSPYDRKRMKQNLEGQIYIVPPMVFNGYIKAINVQRVFATGWKNLQSNNDLQLYISDHVDWDGILKTIEGVKPQEVWTLHGDGKHLKAHFGDKLAVKILN